MKPQFSMTKTLVASAALVACLSTVAHADDNSMSQFGGDSYAYFHEDKPVLDNRPSTFRQANPHGLSIAQYDALSNEDPTWQPAPQPADNAPSTFRRDNPHGLSVREYQALSNEDQMWQLPAQTQLSATASGNPTIVATAPGPLGSGDRVSPARNSN